MNAQHEKLEMQGVKALINKKFYGKKQSQGKKVLKKYQSEEKAEQEMEKKNGQA